MMPISSFRYRIRSVTACFERGCAETSLEDAIFGAERLNTVIVCYRGLELIDIEIRGRVGTAKLRLT